MLHYRKDDPSDLDDRYCNGHFVTQHDMLRELAIHQSSQEAIELRNRLITEIIGKGQPKDWVGMLKQPLTARLVSISTGMLSLSSSLLHSIPYFQLKIKLHSTATRLGSHSYIIQFIDCR